ncbi:hypothetical protein B1R32_10789 [Abditibacterium utsteinense]|uniref:Uncharacterized protein n=1 Tax=Abditibacterium utsteinense TaxID=1960156 RepID=A0A2S8STD1_9BACT|nr:hypothetical protein [Abditibacterium utsteinense]PQV64064.1 hypothetical protein B1R32_10789 [Abditibacterium utsteinense]
MEISDLNGTGRWSLQAIQERYVLYALQLNVFPILDLTSNTHEENGRQWIYPVMFQVIEGIEQGDRACIEIGIEFVEENERFSFGRIIKSNTARALRRSVLSPDQAERIRSRVVHMLIAEHVPREYREYAKLFRKVGIGIYWFFIEERVNRNNPYVMRYYNYFHQYIRTE